MVVLICFLKNHNHPVTIYVSEEKLTTIQDQKDENKVDSKHVESDYLPLCFSSLEWLKRRLRVFDNKKIEI